MSIVSTEIVSLSPHRVPKLNVVVPFVSPHDIGSLSFRVAEAEHHIRLNVVSLALMLVDEVEIVAEEDCMLFEVSSPQVQEFLRGAP